MQKTVKTTLRQRPTTTCHSVTTTPRRRRTTTTEKSVRSVNHACKAHCEHCNNLLPSVLLHGHASLTPPRMLCFQCLIFPAQTPSCNVFSRTKVSSARDSILFLMTTQFFRRELRKCCASWQVAELSRPVSSLSLGCQNSAASAECDTTLGRPGLFLCDRCLIARDNLSAAACLRMARACINFKILFCQSCCLGHSPLCLWITLEKSCSSSIQRTV